MKTNQLLAVIFLTCSLSSLIHAKGDTHKTAVVDCAGEGTKCSAVVNAIGDVISFDASKYSPKFLGKLTAEKSINLQLPDQPDTQKLYSIIPSTGESAGKLIYLLFDNVKPKAGSKDAGKNVIKIYRQYQGEKATQWTEVGQIVTPEKTLDVEPVTFKPDGTAVWKRPESDELFIFALGRKNLKG